MSLRDFRDWAVGGYVAGRDARATCFTRGYCLNLDTRRGRATMWVLNLDDAIRRGPMDVRRWAADQLARAALRLRGCRTYVFGYYDCTRGDRAAKVADSLRFHLLLKLEPHDLAEAEEMVNELAQMKGACWASNDAKAPDPQLELMPHPIPGPILEKAYDVAAWMTANGYGPGWKLGPIQARDREGEA